MSSERPGVALTTYLVVIDVYGGATVLTADVALWNHRSDLQVG